MAWPLAGVGQIGSPFGADRDGGARKHEGNDIAASKLTPVVAVGDGVVTRVVQQQGTPNCCYAIIGHADGWSSYYIHLNNDMFGTDDGLGVGVRTDLVEGTPVTRGEVIGWVGDSGNAEETIDHLHFELHNPEGLAVDPRPSLMAAQAAGAFADPQPAWPYADDDGRSGEEAAARLLTGGLLLGCDGSAVNFCPDDLADPQLAARVANHFAGKVTPLLEDHYQPVTGTAGCPAVDHCLLQGLTEADLARLAMWIRIDALVSTLRPKTASEDVREVVLPTVEEAEEKLRAMGALRSCDPPLDQVRVLTRDEAVQRLEAWMSGRKPAPCPPRGQ
jgi:murein DD-endopeptidase MepM/ murein hydrolase activator NlpD